jgi:hypothetical protein
MKNDTPVPQPSAETLTMLKQLAGYVVARHPMDSEARKLLSAATEEQQNQIRLVLAAIGSHKMKGMADMLKAIDFLKMRAMDPENLVQAAKDPAELRKWIRLLKDLEESDIEFLRMMTASGAEKDGFSADPKQQYNFFFAPAKPGAALTPEDMSSDSRRKIMSVLEKVMALAEGNLPKPPSKDHRVIDVTLEGENNCPSK